MRTVKAKLAASAATALTLTLASGTAADQYDPPASYYSGATGTGATLKSQLTTAMTAGHIQRSYGDFRSSAALHDANPDIGGWIYLCYNRWTVPAQWDAGSTWNREHVWPQSLQPGSASNSSRGNLGDPHALRPADPGTNSSRSNKPFGLDATTGPNRSLGTYYFTGDADKGDIARSLFYSDTRWTSLGIQLVNGTPGSNQMGSLSSLIAWHYLDTPDTFERRRNHVIFSQAENPFYYTNNRNAFVDNPEFVWSIYVDQFNDTQLSVATPNTDGSSTLDLEINTIVGQPLDPISFTIDKSGSDGTYYSVTPSAGLETDISGKHNAFPMLGFGAQSFTTQNVQISFPAGTTDAAGLSSETIIVDNRDVTTQGGMGVGANDADDIVTIDIGVYDMFEPSFALDTDTNSITVDLGTITTSGGSTSTQIHFYNLAGSLGAPYDAQLISSSGDTDELSVTQNAAEDVSDANPVAIDAVLDAETAGEFSATYTFSTSAAASLFTSPISAETLTINLTGEVVESDCLADFSEPFGELDFFDISAFLSALTNEEPRADLVQDGSYDFFDISMFLDLYSQGCP